jgi:hypothetical protein
MFKLNRKLNIASGVFVTLVSLSNISAAQNVAMHPDDLDRFVVDCKLKEQQIAMLQSMRQSRNDIAAARVNNAFKPWTVITDPRNYNYHSQVGSGRVNWLIDQLLMQLRDYC